MSALFAFGLALLLTLLTTPFAQWIGHQLNLVDRPGGRRQHQGAIPRLGGVSVFIGFAGAALVLFLFFPLQDANHRLPLLGVLLGTVFVFLFGLADDKYQFKAAPQLAAHIIAGIIAIATEAFIEEITIPFFGPVNFKPWRWWVTYPLTLTWVVLMMNTVNLLDGLDGLATGVSGIAALLFAIHAYFQLGQTDIALYALALAGACAGFLVFNAHPARIFLGSAGALVLGYALATLSILAPARMATALLVMAIPLTDALFQAMDRWRRGQPLGQGDRGHLHFRLIDLGYSHQQIVGGYWLFCAVFGLLALVIPSPLYKLGALSILVIIVVGFIIVLMRRQNPSA